MLYDLLLIGIGLIIGWNVLPQPQWVKNAYDFVVATVKGWFNN